MKVKPLTDRVLVKIQESETKSAGGIIIPQTAQEKTQTGLVIAVGTDKDVIKVKEGDKVKVTVMFRGREIAFTEIGRRLMDQIKAALADECVMDQEPRLEGRNMIMIVAPKK